MSGLCQAGIFCWGFLLALMRAVSESSFQIVIMETLFFSGCEDGGKLLKNVKPNSDVCNDQYLLNKEEPCICP